MKTFLAATIAVTLALPAFSAARLTYQIRDAEVQVAWPQSSFPMRYEVDRRVVNATPEAAATVDRAFAEWAAAIDTNVTFTNGGVRDGLSAGKDGHNTISIADDLFAGQRYVALTTNWYDDDGTMREGDIQLDPSALNGNYNLQQVVAHEIGHVLGLDHSAVISAVMYPYVGRGGTLALDSDDRVAITSIYPKSDPSVRGATLKGRVTGDSGGIFAAQVVAVSDTGEPVATGLTNAQGDFVLDSIPAGRYRLYAEPLDGPVDIRNLSGVWQQAKLVSFPTEFAAGAIDVQPGVIYGNLVLSTNGSSKLNPRWIGSTKAGSTDISLAASAVVLRAGQQVTIAVGGDGFTSGMTTFEVLNPGFRRISDFRYSSNYASATFDVATDTVPGSAVILVRSGNETATLTGALRIEGTPRARVARR
jgi:predicted Zn-dependent protease